MLCCSVIFHLTPPKPEKLGRCHSPTVGLDEAGIEDAVKDPTIPDHTCQNRAGRFGGIYRRPLFIFHVITCMEIRGINEKKQ